MTEPDKPPLPPFTLETATKKVKAAEDAWNTCDPAKVSMAYTPGSMFSVRALPRQHCMPSPQSGATSSGVSSCVGTVESKWRNRDEFFEGRDAIKAFLTKKWEKELQYKLMKELWCYQGSRISVRFEYEYHDHNGQWWRAHGNEVCPMLLVAEMACMLAHEDSLCAYSAHQRMSQSDRFCVLQHWEFDDQGFMLRRDMSANDYKIQESERRYK